jgi:hypothetical protein
MPGGDLALQSRLNAAIRRLEGESLRFRAALPDPRLVSAYDQWLARRQAGLDKRKIVQQAERAVGSVECLLQFVVRLVPGWDRFPAVLRLEGEVRHWRNERKKHPTAEYWELDRIVRDASQLYDLALSRVRTEWARLERAGLTPQLLEPPAGARAAAAAQPDVAEAAPPRAVDRRPKQKTWVEFKLVDDDGVPVEGAEYRVKLPDGSIRTGTLDDQGWVRFDDIDPGNCEITFPELELRDWGVR